MLTADEYRRAEFDVTREEAHRGFKIHALVFAIVMTGLATLNAILWVYTDAHFPWAIFPLVGWGIGLTFHFFDAYRWDVRNIRNRQARIEERARRDHIPA